MKNISFDRPFTHANQSDQPAQIPSATALLINPPKISSSLPPLIKPPKAKFSSQSWLTLHRQFVQYGRNAKEWTRKCILLLPEIQKQQIWKKKRFSSIYEYAAKLAGMNRNQVDDALWILKKIEDKPNLMAVIEAKGINAIRPVIAIATAENEQFLAEKAGIMSNNTLRIFVQHFKNNEKSNLQSDKFRDIPKTQSVNLQTGRESLQSGMESLQAGNSQNLPIHIQPHPTPQKATIAMQLDSELADKLNKLKGSGDWNELMKKFIELYEKNLEENKPEIVEVKPKIYTSRSIPAAIKKHILAKTNGTCAFPNCRKPHVILHHTDRFAMYNTHDPDHIIPFCAAHERLAHLGLIENENQEPQSWKIRSYPDYDNPKYEIDQIVEKFRQPKE